ncbi:hypothetical protein [Nocardioides sp. SYSU DS0663]|uniref:hypothetical protein n=1 Tax=Nocardioides sp. SYSU DS0663 TaxID=3416445 RepID=UPI003F4C7FBA
MTSGKALLAACGVIVVVSVALSVALGYADDSSLERLGSVVLIGGLALAAVVGVAGVLSLRGSRRPPRGENDVLP